MTLKTSLGYVSVVPVGQRKEGATVNCQGDAAAYAPIDCQNGEGVIGLVMKAVTNDPKNAQVFVVRENQFTQEMGNELRFAVPVKWIGDAPKTRERGKDNIDIIILMEDGRFVDVQCGIVTRKGKFFMTAQRVYEGHVVRTRDDQNKVVWDTIPTRPIHAYPGATYAGVWSTLAEALMVRAHSKESSERKSLVRAAEWTPFRVPPTNGGGWVCGNVDYFNLITGTGQIQGKDGVKYFVHFSDIIDAKDGIPMLTPQSGVLFRPAEDNGHTRPPIKSVKSVKQVDYTQMPVGK